MQPVSVRGCAWALSLLLWTSGAPRSNTAAAVRAQAAERPALVRDIVWDEVPAPLQTMLSQRGISRATFAQHVADLRRRNQARLREGDLDHLVYYVLQSSAFTRLSPIEPAASAAELVGSLTAEPRLDFLSGKDLPPSAAPRAVQARIDAFATAIGRSGRTARLAYFREILADARVDGDHVLFLSGQYLRAMRFLYEKEFAAIGTGGSAPAGSTLYHERGLSSDTSVDAGYVVYLALATLRRLEPDRRIQDVLIVGPGLDLAPRTGLVEAGDPQSYQPFAVMDALLGAGLARRGELRVQAADINPRVVGWLRGMRGKTPRLAAISGVVETDQVQLSEDYRGYFAGLGRDIGREQPMTGFDPRRLAKSIVLSPGITDAIAAAAVDITVERLDERYDLIVVTNVFPYLSDEDLLLALSNIVRMLKPGGVLLHNEPRPLLAEASLALGLPLMHSRSAIVATVQGGRPPLYDSVWMHRAPDAPPRQ